MTIIFIFITKWRTLSYSALVSVTTICWTKPILFGTFVNRSEDIVADHLETFFSPGWRSFVLLKSESNQTLTHSATKNPQFCLVLVFLLILNQKDERWSNYLCPEFTLFISYKCETLTLTYISLSDQNIYIFRNVLTICPKD